LEKEHIVALQRVANVPTGMEFADLVIALDSNATTSSRKGLW